MALFAVAYGIAVASSIGFRIEAGQATTLNGAAGLAVAGSAWFGAWSIPLCFVCEWIAGIFLSSRADAIAGAIAVAVQAAFSYCFFRFVVRRRPELTNLADGFAVVACSLLIASPFGGRWHEFSEFARGNRSIAHAATASLPWWIGDGLGALVVAPLALSWAQWKRRDWDRLSFSRVLELAAVFGCLMGIGLLFWSGKTEIARANLPTSLGILPFVVWAALRLGRRAVTAANWTVAGIVLVGTIHGYGPFGEDPIGRMPLAQIYVAILTGTGLLIALVIAERRRVADELREREMQLRLITDTAPVLIGQFDVHGALQFANHALQEWHGEQTQLIGQKAQWLFNDTIVGAIEAALQGAEPPFHATLRHPRLGERFVEGRVAPLTGPNGEIVGGVILLNDVTEQRTLEVQLRQAMKMEAVGQLAGGIAHDFNNLLSIITGNLSLVEDELPASARPMIQESLKACRRGATLVGQLLTFGRKLPVAKERKQPGKIIEEVVGIVRATFDRRIELVVQVDARLPDVVVDAEQIEQVLLNLLINARDALLALPMVDSPRVMKIRLSAKAVFFSAEAALRTLDARPGPFVAIAVEDTGVGLRPEIQAKIFEPFFTTKDVGKGTGLGLSSAYGTVRQHGGWITVSSEVGKGAVFTVYLPAVVAAPVAELPAAPKPTETRGDETLLIVDDEEMVRRVLRRVLENAGYSIVEAADGQQALETYVSQYDQIDLVVLDLSMPRMSGSETLTRLRLLDPHLPVVVCSGYDLADQSDRMQFDGVATIAKPYRNQDMLKTIRDALDSACRPLRST